MGVEKLAQTIHQILSAPDTDLSTVSAKRVRKQLVELHPDVTLDFVKLNKDAIDTLIGNIFESLNTPDTGTSFRAESSHVSVKGNGNGNGKRKREDNDRRGETKVRNGGADIQGEDELTPGEEEDEPDSYSPATAVAKKVKKTSSRALTDEEYARQLSSEINQRPSRGGRKANGPQKKGASRTPKRKKSRAQIEDSEEDGEAEGSSRNKQSRKKTSSTGGDAKGGFAKEYSLRYVLTRILLILVIVFM